MKYLGTKTLCAIFLFCVAGCTTQNMTPQEIEQTAVPGTTSETTQKINDQLFASANLASDRSDYVLGSGDLLEIKVLEAEKLDTTVRVSSRGQISLPLLGEIDVKGKTASEAETLIEDSYRKSYIKDPHVSIFVKEHYSQRVTLFGQVKSPGTYDYPSKLRLLDALAMAGGISDRAGYTIQVRRYSGMSTGSQETFFVDLDKLNVQGNAELNIEINGGDIIFVPDAGSYYIDGAVRKPGQYFIQHVISIKEALLAAGGVAPYANLEKLLLMRKTDAGRKEILINMKKDDQKIEHMTVQEDDILYVNASFWGKVLHGGGINIGIGGTGVTYRDPQR